MSWFSHETAHFKIWDCCVLMPFLKDHCRIYLRLIVFPFSDNFSKVSLTYLVTVPAGGLLQIFPPDYLSSVWAPLIPWLFRGLSKTTGGVSEKDWTKTFVSSYIATINGNILLVSCAERMEIWIGVFGGGRKEMLSLLNEGGFTQYNEGWTHGFTADVYLKGLVNTVSEQKALSADIHIPCNHRPPHEGQSYLLDHFYSCFFFFIWKGGKMWDFISLTLWEFVWNPRR